LTRLWPYIALLISFAAFVLWNGGVVLGDKSNHVATIHLPQLLYLWPFIAFFSWPLLLSPALSLLQYASETINYLIIPSPIPKLPTLRKLAFLAAYTAVALLATLLVIHFNTIIHPFTLADNRHYVFYVFRYTILRHSLIRYLLAPIYLACFYLVYLSLAGSSPLSSSLQNFKGPRRIFQVPNPRHHIRIRKGEWEGPNTSFFLIWILSTALSLITAPLVEPRYFILPWVLWRLHLPSLSTPSSFTYTMPGPAPPPSSSEYSRSSSAAFAKRFSQYTSGPETMELTQPAPPPQSAEQRAAEGKVNAIIESQNPNGEENLHAAGVPVPTQTQTQTQRAAHGLVLSSSIPTLSSSSTWPSSPSERGARSQSSDAATSSASEKEDGGLETMSDYALWIETLWFLVINAVTGYIFLYWGFEWASEPGAVQRFMW
jgi:hypothetical protein